MTKPLILTGTPHCDLCCHAVPFLHAKKWLTSASPSAVSLGTYCSESPNTDLLGWWFSKGNIFIPIHPFTDGSAEAEGARGIQLRPV